MPREFEPKKSQRPIESRVTEGSLYPDIEKMSSRAIIVAINKEDQKVPRAIEEQCIDQIDALCEKIIEQQQKGHKLFYMGAGTSGRLGVLDASEIPPTYGMDSFVGMIAGGEGALLKAVEGAEDDPKQGWKDLQERGIEKGDVVIGIAASGGTPYVLEALKKCRENGITTGSVTCNPDSPIEKESDFPVVCVVGPEVVQGSTRMKAGTATKLILNTISTTTMIKLERTKKGRMFYMPVTNKKLEKRAMGIIMDNVEELGIDIDEKKAAAYLKYCKTAGDTLDALKNGITLEELDSKSS
jgi:N-acetylmuramic acid 6-phosphate etherase